MSATRNEETLEMLMEALASNGGDMANAGRRCGVSYSWIKSWMRDDAKVEQAIKDATEAGTAVIESAAIKRAVKGVKEPILHNGEIVAYKRKYSDGLAQFLLTHRKPEVYSQKIDINKTITVKTLSDDEINQRIAGITERLGLPNLVEEAEFTEILSIIDDKIDLED